MPPQHTLRARQRQARHTSRPEPASGKHARKITALTANPACSRRAVLDASGADKAVLAQRMGYEPRFGQSPFAIGRERNFEALVKLGSYAELIRLLREQLGVPVEESAATDLNEVGVATSLSAGGGNTQPPGPLGFRQRREA